MIGSKSTGTQPASAGGRVLAVLGPTNTGKTFLAMERLMAHRTGMIGFPLRLLARENYDKVVKLKGAKAVALITGEEKIIPPNPQYWICTVESMPLDRPVQFLAVDEIQLSADPERGHIFTDRLLHARGSEETMFLGSDTIRPLLMRLVPRAEYVSRPRFSQLSFAGHKKLTRLPPRSAIVAFSVTDVYSLAEMVRRSRGGTAVVMGALSPRTRNAQVAMYQAGDVDYLVATDAVGMGLNMDVDHVWFARMSKFDGFQPRRLRATEVAQIAGRAGRHLTDGTFGTTADCDPMDEETVEAVENHQFPSLTHIMWRNSDLDFRSVPALIRSLEVRATAPELIRAREADDHLALQALAKEEELLALATSRQAVGLLWEVCQIPDFRKVLSDQHTKLLAQIYRHLMAPPQRLPEDWVAAQVARLDRTEGDIDALVARIAHVRTWTYVSHRADWLADPAAWQERTRGIEDKLSDALHERLTQRFVDKRSAGLVKSLRGGKELLGSVGRGGIVMVEGHPVGELEGLRFTLDAEVAPEDQKAVMTAARKALKDEIAARLARIDTAEDKEFTLRDDGILLWDGAELGRLTPGPSVLKPQVRVLHDDLLDAPQRDRVKERLTKWLEAHVADRLGALVRLETEEQVEGQPFAGAARGIAFQVAEALGGLPRARLESMIQTLTKEQRRQLASLGVRLGFSHVFLPALAKPKAVALRAILWAVKHGEALPVAVPPGGRVSVPEGELPAAMLEAVGYPKVGPRAIRVDMLDRLEKEMATRAKAGPVTKVADLTQLIGCTMDELTGVLAALGWKPMTMPAPPPAPATPEAVVPEPAAPEAVTAEAAEPAGAVETDAGTAQAVQAEPVAVEPSPAVETETAAEPVAAEAIEPVAMGGEPVLAEPLTVETTPDTKPDTAEVVAEPEVGPEDVATTPAEAATAEAATAEAEGEAKKPETITVWVRVPRRERGPRPEGQRHRHARDRRPATPAQPGAEGAGVEAAADGERPAGAKRRRRRKPGATDRRPETRPEGAAAHPPAGAATQPTAGAEARPPRPEGQPGGRRDDRRPQGPQAKRPGGPRPEGPRPEGPRQEGPRQDGPRREDRRDDRRGPRRDERFRDDRAPKVFSAGPQKSKEVDPDHPFAKLRDLLGQR